MVNKTARHVSVVRQSQFGVRLKVSDADVQRLDSDGLNGAW